MFQLLLILNNYLQKCIERIKNLSLLKWRIPDLVHQEKCFFDITKFSIGYHLKLNFSWIEQEVC